MLLDEIFGRENFVANFIWNHRKSRQNDIDLSLSHNYVLCYAIDKARFKLNPLPADSSKFANPDEDPRGPWVADPFDAPNIRPNLTYPIVNPNTEKEYWPPEGRCWRFTQDKFMEALEDNRIVFGKKGKSKPQYKRFWSEAEQKGMKPQTIWDDVGTATGATRHLMKLFQRKDVFSTPKPEGLLERIIHIATDTGDIVLDFFAGSATTAAVSHKMGRQWIAIEQLSYIETTTLPRLNKVIGRKAVTDGAPPQDLAYDTGGISESVNWKGGGDFIYCELSPYNRIFVDRILAAQSSEQLVRLWRDLSSNTFLNWYFNPGDPDDAEAEFTALGDTERGLEKQRTCLMDLLDKNQLYVNLSEIDDDDFDVSDQDKELNQQFFGNAS